MISPLSLLQQGVASLLPYFDLKTGMLNDPVFGCPTQYSTPYFAWCNAVLAAQSGGPERGEYARLARQALQAALDYVLATGLPPFPSDFQPDTGASSGRNHRDFFWPAILKSWKLLADCSPDPADGSIREKISQVDILASFAQRPPSNWAMVWLSGEWLRIRAGLSPFSREQ